ncbi:hypothetical protein HK102_009097, partial [Quaeritorhiza haematococci]
MKLEPLYEPLLDGGWVPDFLLRIGTRYLLSRRLREIEFGSPERNNDYKMKYVQSLKIDYQDKIAVHTKEANEQHYEVPTEFF